MVLINHIAERQLPHKATLYCPRCTHASRINGDWVIEIHEDYLDYECPECGHTVESRPNQTGAITM